jgi:hypothetical protein
MGKSRIVSRLIRFIGEAMPSRALRLCVICGFGDLCVRRHSSTVFTVEWKISHKDHQGHEAAHFTTPCQFQISSHNRRLLKMQRKSSPGSGKPDAGSRVRGRSKRKSHLAFKPSSAPLCARLAFSMASIRMSFSFSLVTTPVRLLRIFKCSPVDSSRFFKALVRAVALGLRS